MRQTLTAAAVAAVLGLTAAQTAAQDTKSGASKVAPAPAASLPHPSNAVGVVTAVTNSLLTIETGKGQLSYAIDGKTQVSGFGLERQARRMKQTGERMAFSRFVQKGDTVRVRHDRANGNNHASEVQVTRKRA